MFFKTKKEARAFLNAQNFIPSLKAKHKIVDTIRRNTDGTITNGYTIVLNLPKKV